MARRPTFPTVITILPLLRSSSLARPAANLSAVAVVSNSVDASAGVGDDVLGRKADNASSDGGWG
jgi:hypothetical protein